MPERDADAVEDVAGDQPVLGKGGLMGGLLLPARARRLYRRDYLADLVELAQARPAALAGGFVSDKERSRKRGVGEEPEMVSLLAACVEDNRAWWLERLLARGMRPNAAERGELMRKAASASDAATVKLLARADPASVYQRSGERGGIREDALGWAIHGQNGDAAAALMGIAELDAVAEGGGGAAGCPGPRLARPQRG